VWLADQTRFANYLRPDEMHTAFNFDFMARPWDARELRASIDMTLAAHRPVGAPATWVLSNHDVTRPVTRYGRAETGFAFESKRVGTPTDLARGTRRARAAALLAMALPGSLYIYQGEELGLPEVEDIPADRRQDPMWHRSGGVDPGRDGCRVPLPWAGQRPPFAFSENGEGRPWLDQPDDWGPLTVEVESKDPASMLNLYRAGLNLRRTIAALGDGDLRWLPSSDSVLAFARGEDFICLVNFGPDPVDLPDGARVLLASSELEGGAVPYDSTVWLRQTNPHDPSGDPRSPRADTSDRSNHPASGTVPVLRKG
jgi:alpha-glucosidase